MSENDTPKRKKSFFKRWWFWLLVLIVIIIAVPKGGNNRGTVPAPGNTPTPTSTKASKVSYENFAKLNMGAKLEDITALFGQGEETSSSEIGGIKTVIYTWNGPGISNMNVTVQNGVVTGKAQTGLKTMDAKVTLAMYNQIKNGMTYDQVKGILGEGQLTSQTRIADIESSLYSWINSDGSNMNATFSGGKLNTKAQFSLK